MQWDRPEGCLQGAISLFLMFSVLVGVGYLFALFRCWVGCCGPLCA